VWLFAAMKKNQKQTLQELQLDKNVWALYQGNGMASKQIRFFAKKICCIFFRSLN
jgi:hypothetical protein